MQQEDKHLLGHGTASKSGGLVATQIAFWQQFAFAATECVCFKCQ